jgi:uncharacterized protein involved in response to NO
MQANYPLTTLPPGNLVARKRLKSISSLKTSQRISLKDFAKEPFRIFFPIGVLSGILGASLWPLYFWQVMGFYPGQTHARIMIFGLLGGFVLGFLGTAMPRMLSAKSFRLAEVIPLLAVHLAMVFSWFFAKIFWGDILLLALLAGFFVCIAIRARQRQDTPPPGFVLVGMSFLCVTAGAILAVLENLRELDPSWITLQRLLSYQGFILLPVLGIGPFLLPRLFGMENRHDFPETLVPTKPWVKKALLAFVAGAIIVGSFFLEAFNWLRLAHALRFAAVLFYLLVEMPFHRAPKVGNPLGAAIRIGFICILAGFLTVAIWPAYRVALLHLTFIGGFAVITFTVATRVVFGHSGNIALLKKRNRWLLVSIGIMLFGMATRISGDFFPKVTQSHYIYGAIVWIIGVLLWSIYVLPKVFEVENEEGENHG